MKETKYFNAFQNRPGSKPEKQRLDQPAAYEFRIAQALSDQWAAWFDGLEFTCDEQGNTLLTGTMIDQAALHGVLAKIRDLNLVLLSVRRK